MIKKFARILWILILFLNFGLILNTNAEENTSVVGKTFGEVIKDKRIAEALIKSYNQNIKIEYDSEGNITNLITSDYLNNITRLVCTLDPKTDTEPLSLEGIENFSNINNVQLYNSNLEDFPKELLQLPNMAVIKLHGTSEKPRTIPFSLPRELTNLDKLTILSLNNTLIKEIPEWLSELNNLTWLNLTGSNVDNHATFTLPNDIDKLVNLQKLEISNNHMTELPENLHNLSNLTTFRFVNNNLENISQENFDFIKSRTTKFVYDQQTTFEKKEIQDKDYDLYFEMPPIVEFLINQSHNDSNIVFTLYAYNDDYSEIIEEINLPIEEVYQNGLFILDKKYIQSHNKYKILAQETNGVFKYSWFNYYFNAEVIPKVVNIRYIDSFDKEITESVFKTGRLGESWISKQLEIDGYRFKEVKGDTEGIFTKEPQYVTYVYSKVTPSIVIDPIEKGNIIIKYEDTNGNLISDTIYLDGQVGKKWTSKQLEIDGYKFKEVKGNTEGIFTKEDQYVTYVYFKENFEKQTDLKKIGTEKKESKKLPQTGEKSNVLAFVGGSLIIIGLWFFLSKKVKLK